MHRYKRAFKNTTPENVKHVMTDICKKGKQQGVIDDAIDQCNGIDVSSGEARGFGVGGGL